MKPREITPTEKRQMAELYFRGGAVLRDLYVLFNFSDCKKINRALTEMMNNPIFMAEIGLAAPSYINPAENSFAAKTAYYDTEKEMLSCPCIGEKLPEMVVLGDGETIKAHRQTQGQDGG